MSKAQKWATRFWFMLIAIFLLANTSIAQQVKPDCKGGRCTSTTGEFIALPDSVSMLRIASLPFLVNNALMAVRIQIANQMPNQEKLTNGYWSLEFHYSPAGGHSDGSEDIRVPATATVDVGELLYGNVIEATFSPQNTIPVENWPSLGCTLIFTGTIGGLGNAMLVQSVSPGDLLFNEEWDNGLTGNYAWRSSPPDQNPDNGTSLTSVSGGKLTMTNTRVSGSDKARTNDLGVRLTDGANPNGIKITADSFIQFVIDEMTSSTTDALKAAHIMTFRFSDGSSNFMLQYSASGPQLAGGSTTLHRSFTPGRLIIENIYAVFQDHDIILPKTLYLVDVGFLQQVYQDPEAQPQSLRMVADAVRVVAQSTQ
jgi:hypothetical protein